MGGGRAGRRRPGRRRRGRRPRSTLAEAASGADGRGQLRGGGAVRALPRQRRRAGHADRDLPALPGHRPAAGRRRARRSARWCARPCATSATATAGWPASPCKVCRGRGRKVERPKVKVDVPAGIADGQRIRIAGRGHAGERGGPAGRPVRADPRARGPAVRARRRRPRDRGRRGGAAGGARHDRRRSPTVDGPSRARDPGRDAAARDADRARRRHAGAARPPHGRPAGGRQRRRSRAI